MNNATLPSLISADRLTEEQAQWMTSRVQDDPNIVTELRVGERAAVVQGDLHRFLECCLACVGRVAAGAVGLGWHYADL
jgi:hypothetical protein